MEMNPFLDDQVIWIYPENFETNRTDAHIADIRPTRNKNIFIFFFFHLCMKKGCLVCISLSG